MPGKMISKANLARIQQMHDQTAALGAQCGSPAKWARKEQGLFDRIDAVRHAMLGAVTLAEGYDVYPHLEDVYDTYAVIEIGEVYYRADYTMAVDGTVTLAARDAWQQVEEVWQPVSGAKGLAIAAEGRATAVATMKALGDRQIEVKVAYGGHRGGKDSHGEFFSAKTDFDTENFPTPPLLYYHGFDEQGRKMGKPAVTGKMVSRRADADGHVLIYQLKSGTYADRQWAAALKGECAVSPGTVGHLIRKAPDGELLYWPLAEVSAWDAAPNRKQANLYSVAAPVLKAAYLEAGLDIPAPIRDTPPEAAGDAASAEAIDPETVKQTIAAEVARVLLTTRKL